jgi:radical SAM superfamily enzyme YgiQ (UPF0313 family)
MTRSTLRVVLLKPSKYRPDGFVERFRWGYMPNGTLPHIRSLTPPRLDAVPLSVHCIDECVESDTTYLRLLDARDTPTLLALVGVQSHQIHRALDLGLLARRGGSLVVLGGPHALTCSTDEVMRAGISIAAGEAEDVWLDILRDALSGVLRPRYAAGSNGRLAPQPIHPPSLAQLRRYVVPMLGLYPARGCPYRCTFCSVPQIAGRRVTAQPIDVTLESIRRAKAAGVQVVLFTSDNFNKYREAPELLERMIDERLTIPFMAQCDAQIGKQEDLISLLGRAGCFQMFIGVESSNRQTLKAIHKFHNDPANYAAIAGLCARHGIASHFSNIIGFPWETRAEISARIREIDTELRPDWASFFILCPMPGTVQYEDFRLDGVIVERNLDRFDATCLTWQHRTLTAAELRESMYGAYRRFYSVGRIRRRMSNLPDVAAKRQRLGSQLFHLFCGYARIHPLSGGVWRLKRDHERDYLPAREAAMGARYLPLPSSTGVSL